MEIERWEGKNGAGSSLAITADEIDVIAKNSGASPSNSTQSNSTNSSVDERIPF